MLRRLASGEVVPAEELDVRVRPPPAMPVARTVVALRSRTSFQPETVDLASDAGLLEALLRVEHRLDEYERRAFAGMLDRYRIRGTTLTYTQRAWAQEVGERVGLGTEAPVGWREVARAVRNDGSAVRRSR